MLTTKIASMMNVLLIIFFTFMIESCCIQSSKKHGYNMTESSFQEVVVGNDKEQVMQILGQPTFLSESGEYWYYVQQTLTRKSLINFADISKSTILLIHFQKDKVDNIVSYENEVNLDDFKYKKGYDITRQDFKTEIKKMLESLQPGIKN